MLGFVVPGGAIAAAAAEVFAVAGALGADIGTFGTYLIAVTLVTGTVVLGMQLALPWVVAHREAPSVCVRWLYASAVAMIAVATVFLHDSVQRAAATLSADRLGEFGYQRMVELESARLTSEQERVRALLLGRKISRAEASNRLIANEDSRMSLINGAVKVNVDRVINDLEASRP